MSWLRNLFGRGEARPKAPKHIGILVRGTLLNANMAVNQLGMFGLDKAPHIKGVAPVFGIGGGMKAEETSDRWTHPCHLDPPWLLIIPEDAYAAFRFEFDQEVGKPIDGRVKSSDPSSIVNVNGAAMEEAWRIIESWGPGAQAPAPPGRVEVGQCSACGRSLKVKAAAVRPTMKLTCKCGAAKVVEAADGSEGGADPA